LAALDHRADGAARRPQQICGLIDLEEQWRAAATDAVFLGPIHGQVKVRTLFAALFTRPPSTLAKNCSMRPTEPLVTIAFRVSEEEALKHR
jgi:hypothetical protein